MRITSSTDYCLRVLIYVAAQPDGKATIGSVAATYGISEHHLTKVVHFLGKAGFLRNLRGRGGGVQLARPAARITVGAVVRAAEGGDVPAACFEADGVPCSIARICRLRSVLSEAVAAFYRVLDRYTLEDLLHNREDLARVLIAPSTKARIASHA